MPIQVEILTDIIISLILGVLVLAGGFIVITIERRITRRRFFEELDWARKKVEELVAPVYQSPWDVDAAIRSFRVLDTKAGGQALEEILLQRTKDPKQLAVTRQIVQKMGWIQEWIDTLRCRTNKPSGETARLLAEFGDNYRRPRGVRGMRLRLLANSITRCMAANKLARVPTPEGLRALVAGIEDPHPEVQEICFRHLGNLADPATLPVLIEKLIGVIEGKSPLSVRDVKTALVHFLLEDVGALHKALEHSHRRVRFFATDIIREIADRHAATEFLGKNDFSPQIYRLFTERLFQDEWGDVRARAAVVIAHFHDGTSNRILEKLLQDEAWFVRLHACRAVASKFFLPIAPVVAQRISDSHWLVREAATRALCKMGEPGIEHITQVFLTNQDRYVTEQICEELQRSGILFNILGNVTDEKQRERVLGVVRRMASLNKVAVLRSYLLAPVPAELKLLLIQGLADGFSPECLEVLHHCAENDPEPQVRDAALAAYQNAEARAASDMPLVGGN
ncbi:MAG: HEAT repeat domain-containing protein [Acidobacteria bacterium]|nr:HEAT repeat domain-containing protein [Acidobacteriota bacterium]